MEKSAADGMDYTQLNVWQSSRDFFISNKDLGDNGKTEKIVSIFENGSKIILTSSSGRLFQFLLKYSVWV